MPLLLASLTGPLVSLATNLIDSLGLAGVALLMAMSNVIGVPGTEPTMLFAGFDVYLGHLTLPGVIIAGTAGDAAGGSIAYAIGYYGGRELLERRGSKLHVNPAGLARAHRWFERYGTSAIFISRLLPFVRSAFPYAAGVAQMPFRRFLPVAALASLIWVGGLGVLGREVGSQWQAWRHHLQYVDYVGAAVVVTVIVAMVIRWRRRRASRARTGEPAVDVVPD